MMIDSTAFDTMRATQEAAWWASSTAAAAWIFGVATLALNAVGLTIVWRQLRTSVAATKAATEAANAALSETRPWVQIELTSAFLERHINSNGRISAAFRLEVKMTNIGSIPAFHCWGDLLVYDELPPSGTLVAGRQGDPLLGVTLFPAQTISVSHLVVIEPEFVKQTQWNAVLCATYLIPGRTDIRVTPVALSLNQRQPRTPGTALYGETPGQHEYNLDFGANVITSFPAT